MAIDMKQQEEKERMLLISALPEFDLSPSTVQTLDDPDTGVQPAMTDVFLEGEDVTAADGEEGGLLHAPETLEEHETDDPAIAADGEMGSSLNQYLREMGRVPLLTAEEELRLANVLLRGKEELRRATHHDIAPNSRIVAQAQDAQRRLIEANLRLVVSIARKYQGRGLTLLDLIQEGNNGLMLAVDKFDPTKGYKFSTYATWWIRQFVLRAIANQARTIRLPVHMVDAINRTMRASARLSQELGREPTIEEIAQQVGTSVESVRHLLRASQQPISLETPVGEDGDTALGELVEDQVAPSPSEITTQRQLKERVAEALANLSERERMVVQLRFGLLDGQSRTLSEVGLALNVTRERARQIEAKALQKLRRQYGKQLHDFLS